MPRLRPWSDCTSLKSASHCVSKAVLGLWLLRPLAGLEPPSSVGRGATGGGACGLQSAPPSMPNPKQRPAGPGNAQPLPVHGQAQAYAAASRPLAQCIHHWTHSRPRPGAGVYSAPVPSARGAALPDAAGSSISMPSDGSAVDKVMVTQSRSRATSGNTRHFLQTRIAELPYLLLCIQVDGGEAQHSGWRMSGVLRTLCIARNPSPVPQLPTRRLMGLWSGPNGTAQAESPTPRPSATPTLMLSIRAPPGRERAGAYSPYLILTPFP